MPYRVRRISLAAALDRADLAAPNTAVTSFHVLTVPVGAAPSIRIGSGEPIPIFAGYSADLCGDEQLVGLTVDSAVLVAADLVVQVWTGGGRSAGM